jgi:hypothetical protein
MEINKINSKKFEEYKQKHISESGTVPDAYALTQLIKDSILAKDYIHYEGGGPYEDDHSLFLKKYDVVVSFTLGGDPDFGVVIDEDGDFCDLYSSDENGH